MFFIIIYPKLWDLQNSQTQALILKRLKTQTQKFAFLLGAYTVNNKSVLSILRHITLLNVS
jgi:hypothetical protein